MQNVPDLGQQLRRWRTEHHLTQDEVAKRTDIPGTYISLMENGKILPAGEWARRLAAMLDEDAAEPPPDRQRRQNHRRTLSIGGDIKEALERTRDEIGWEIGCRVTWTTFFKLLLLYWQNCLSSRLPGQAELDDCWEDCYGNIHHI